MSEFKYIGSELDLFADVDNWKSYWSRQIQPFLSGDVIEVGAGIGRIPGFSTQATQPGGYAWSPILNSPASCQLIAEKIAQEGNTRLSAERSIAARPAIRRDSLY